MNIWIGLLSHVDEFSELNQKQKKKRILSGDVSGLPAGMIFSAWMKWGMRRFSIDKSEL